MVTVIIRGVGGMDSTIHGDGIPTGTIIMATAITRTGDMVFTIHGDGILIGITTMVITRTGDTVRDMDIMAQTGVTIDRIGVVPANQL